MKMYVHRGLKFALTLSVGVDGAQTGALSAVEAGANPIRRVVTLLQDMKKEVEAEGEKDAALYKKYQCYCKENDGQLNEDAKQAQETIASNNAAAEQKAGLKKQMKAELKQHLADRKDAQGALAQATEIRKQEQQAYDLATKDHRQYIEAIKQAVDALQKGKGAAFLQQKYSRSFSVLKGMFSNQIASQIDENDRETLKSFFLQQSKDYAPVSGEVIGILKNMLDEFNETLGGVVKIEEEAITNYNALKNAKLQEIQAATDSIESKTALTGKLALQVVQHQNAAATALKELGDAQQFLVQLKKMCTDKAGDWEVRSKKRTDELAAIAEAIKVLNDDDALDVFKKSLSLMQKFNTENKVQNSSMKKSKSSPKSFLQVSPKTNTNTVNDRVEQILKNSMLGQRMSASSSSSSQVAVSLMAHTALQKLKQGVDFSKIVTMVDEMVALLKKEQIDDETTRDWCETELRTSDVDSKDAKSHIARLATEVGELENEIAANKAVIAKKEAEIQALDKSVTDATAQRKQENEDYDEMMSLNHSAVQLIAKAINKLNFYYNPHMYNAPEERELSEDERILRNSGQDIGDVTKKDSILGTTQQTTIMSMSQATPAPPETYGAYKKKGAKSNSVIALLNMLSKELQDEMSTAEMEEKTAQKDYENLMKDAASSRAAAMQAITNTQTDIANEEEAKQVAKTSHTAKAQELAEIEEQIGQLHGKCDFIIAHFEERRSMRDNEIEGLVNAKAILQGAKFD